MALFALLGIAALLALITVNWTPSVARYVTAALVASVVGLMACASAAVLTAARDTYAPRDAQDPSDDGAQ